MSKVQIRLNSAGIDALLKSKEIQECILSQAEGIKDRAGPDYATDTYVTPSRVVASVYTASAAAVQDNLKNNTLLKAVGK